MIKRTLVSILVLVALAGLSVCALGEETQNKSINTTETLNKTETLNPTEELNTTETILETAAPESGLQSLSLVEFAQPSPAVVKVPISLQNNSTKEVWTSPGDKPAFVFAGLTNNGNLRLDVYTISVDPDTNERTAPQLAGTALSAGDGVIVFGKFIAIEVKCENSTVKQNCAGSLETANWFP